jgi:hypothetical protein
MESNYKSWVSENPERKAFVPVNLLLLQFYDSGQIFHWRTSDFNALFTGILNLPPSYRGKVGISNFIQCLFSGKHLSNAEKFIFSDCYCEELRALYVGYQYIGPNGLKYFIQARLIFHSMDTRAAEPLFGLQSFSTSLYGCSLCGKMHGMSDSWKVFFPGHRLFCDEKSILRFYGQSGKCCPKNFYDPNVDNIWFSKESYISSQESIIASADHFADSKDFCLPCDNDYDRSKSIRTFVRKVASSKEDYYWSHKGDRFNYNTLFNLRGFGSILYYRHFDFRNRLSFDLVSKEEHYAAAIEAERSGETVKGIKSMWPFERLPYADMSSHYSFPLYHCLSAIISRMLDYMVGTYVERQLSRKSYKPKLRVKIGINKVIKKKIVPSKKRSLFNGNKDYQDIPSDTSYVPIYRPSYAGNIAPYSSSKTDYEKLSAWLACVLLPTGSQKSLKINLLCPGLLRMEQKVRLVSIYWDFIIGSLDSIDDRYRLFYSMFGCDIQRLLSLRLRKDSIDQLEEDINESVCVWEAIFPVKENYFQLHELLHIVHSIRRFGCPSYITDMSGERSLQSIKKIKKLTNPGGASYERMVFRRHMNRERCRMDEFYGAPINNFDNDAPNHFTKVSYDPEKNVLTYKSFSFMIQSVKGSSSDTFFSPFEIAIH